jgi:hypothetical protein
MRGMPAITGCDCHQMVRCPYWADAEADDFFAEPEQQAPYRQTSLVCIL